MSDDKHGCGSSAGYMRHKRAGEQPCPECRAAWTAYYREYRAIGRKKPAK